MPQSSKVHSTISDRFVLWIRGKIKQYKVITLILCCVLALLLYSTVWNNNLFTINSPITDAYPYKPDLFSFLVIGDWGACDEIPTFENQTNVANAMLSIRKKYSTKFVISVGDHFYDNGIISTDDLRWNTCFENVYNKLLHPWYIIFGNHDMRGSIKAQIEYSKLSPNNRWTSPAHYYSKDFAVPNSNMEFRIIFLDTNNLMCFHEQYTELNDLEQYECDEMFYKLPETASEKHGIDIGSAKEIQKYNFDTERAEQLEWLKHQIDTAHNNHKIRFIIIAAHHALFSQGPHKIPSIFNEHIQPILRRSNKIIAWFCGHNHALEHYIWNRDKHSIETGERLNVMHQFLSGAGGKEVHPMKEAAVETQLDDVLLGYLGKTFGFVSVHLYNENMTVNYWNQYGTHLYDYTVDYPQ